MALIKGTTSTDSPRVWTVADLGSFYVANRAEFLAHASRVLRDPVRAEEVVQDAFMRVVLAAPELESRKHARAYVHRTIENLCMDIFRYESRRPNLVLLDEAIMEVERNWIQSEDLSDSIVAAEDAAIVREALSLLSDAERAALVMWEIEGRSTKEIARELGVKETSVRHTVSRARKSLRRILSEIVIDETRGFTALDLLSNTYRKSAEGAKKSSRIALSLILVLFAFLGISSISNTVTKVDESRVSLVRGISDTIKLSDSTNLYSVVPKTSSTPSPRPLEQTASLENVKVAPIKFPGLDKRGVPLGFTVADSTGSLGSVNFFERSSTFSETQPQISHILKTDVGAANILLSQTIVTDSGGFSYNPTFSYGQAGYWIPLSVKVNSTDITRQMDGNYLLTAYIGVDSAIDTPFKIVATANGRDLAMPPRYVVTRLVLNPSKTLILAQALYVVEREAEA